MTASTTMVREGGEETPRAPGDGLGDGEGAGEEHVEADGGEEEDDVASEDDRGEDEEEHRASMASALEPVGGAEGGEDEGEDVGEGAAGVEEEVELRGGEQRRRRSCRSERGAERAAESTERGHHERGERESRSHLRGHAGAPRVVAHAQQGEGRAEGRGRPRQSDGAHEGARHHPGKT